MCPVLGDELYYTGSKPDKKKVVLHEDEAVELLKFYHSSGTGGHSGINATLSKISQYYTWNGMKQDVLEFVSWVVINTVTKIQNGT